MHRYTQELLQKIQVSMMRQLNLWTVGRTSMQGLRPSRFSSKKDIDVPKVKNFIDGKFVDSLTTKWIPLYNPGN